MNCPVCVRNDRNNSAFEKRRSTGNTFRKNKKTEMNRIVILRSNSISPDPRVQKEAYSLVDNGFRVRIVCWSRDRNDGIINDLIEIEDKKIEIVRIGYKATYGEGVKNLKSFIRFQVMLAKWLFQHRKEYDCIHACDFDTAYISSLVNKLINKKFVFDIFDFLYGDPQNLFQKIIKKIQIKIINGAEVTIICSEKRHEQIRLATPRKLVVIHNTPKQFIDGEKKEFKKINERKIHIVYVGILQDYRLLPEIIDCVGSHSDWYLDIGGFGKYENFVIEKSNTYSNVEFHGCLTYDETLSLERKADIMIAIYDPSKENHYFAAPNKFYEAMMLGKPLVMVKNTGMSEYIEKYNLGVLMEYSKEGFEQGISELVLKKDEWEEMGRKMRNLYKEKFDWRIMEKRLVELYKEL